MARLHENRKAFDMGNTMLIYGILGIIIILLLSFWLYGYYEKARESSAIQNCQTSVAAHVFFDSTTKGTLESSIKCPMRNITINVQKDNTRKVIADDMHRCWYEWNKGESKVYKDDGIYCHVCTVYSFKSAGQQLDGFIYYLATTNVEDKFKEGLPGISYQDYFQRYRTSQSRMFIDSMKDDIKPFDRIDTTKKYASVIVYAVGEDSIKGIYSQTAEATRDSGQLFYSAGQAYSDAGYAGKQGLAFSSAGNSYIPVGWIAKGETLSTAGLGRLTQAHDAKDPTWISSIALVAYEPDEIKRLGCERIETVQLSHKTP